MSAPQTDPARILRRSLENDRIHSSYLLSGAGDLPKVSALTFARALVCRDLVRIEGVGEDGEPEGLEPCERCSGCQRSALRDRTTTDTLLRGR